MEARVPARLTSRFLHGIPELDSRGLRRFGLTTGAMLVALFGLAAPWLLGRPYPAWPWWLAGALGLLALIAPGSLRLVYLLWMRAGMLLNRLTTPLILGAAFFAVITPAALVIRALRRDTLARKFDDRATTYRIRSRSATKQTMEKPF
jgi:hypothetical protein